MKRYMISRQLDVEFDYFITKIDNARFDAQSNNDFDLLDSLERKFARLLELEEDLIINGDGVFTLQKWSESAKECMTLPSATFTLGNLIRRLSRHGGGKTEAKQGLGMSKEKGNSRRQTHP